MIGKILQDILNEKNIKVSELSRMIDVSDQTLYSIIKRNNMKIDFEVLLKICSVLNVDVERFYADYLISLNKSIDSTTRKKLILAFARLNSDGQQKAFEYINDLLENPKYTKTAVSDNKKIKTTQDYEIAAWGADGTKGKTYTSPKKEIT